MLKVPSAAETSAEKRPALSLAAMSDTMAAPTLPTSLGTFKPVGHLMIGLPTQPQVLALATALNQAGWSSTAVQRFLPHESANELRELVSQASSAAGFGSEIALLRRYLVLAEQGYHWLLVKVDDSAHALSASGLALACGATVAVHYRTLTVEEMI